MARKSGTLAGRLALGVGAIALAAAAPSGVLATSLLAEDGARGVFSAFTPASADPRMTEMLVRNGSGQSQMMRFTPAGANSSGIDRSVTVAVRVDQEVAQAISGRTNAERANDTNGTSGSLRIAATRYNLGMARGYSSFAQPPAARPSLSSGLSEARIPDLSEFEPSSGAARDSSRFAARIALDEKQPTAARPGEAVRVSGDPMLDVAGSYRVTRNLDVTAGVRYRQERDLTPLPDLDQQDSQAVYVGTQFRF